MSSTGGGKRVAIVGLGTGAIYAVRWLTALSRDVEVTIIERRHYPTYSPCGLPYALGGEAKLDEVIHPFPETSRIRLLLKHEAVGIDLDARKVAALDSETSKRIEVEYDELILDLGSEPVLPPIPGVELDNVFTVKKVEDVIAMENALGRCGMAVVVGSGAIGLEVAHALRRRGLDVLVVEMLQSLLPKALDANMSKLVEDKLKQLGIEYALASRLEEIRGKPDGGVSSVIVNGEEMAADMVVLSVGVKPNLTIVPDAVETDLGIVVDEGMRTSVPGVYAIGDCTVTRSALTGERATPFLAVPAARQGMTAALSILGKRGRYAGTLGTFVSTIGDMEVACTGMREDDCRGRFDAVSSKAKHLHKPDWLHGEPLTLKLVVEKGTLRILGAQAVGAGASGAVNRIAMAMRLGGTLVDLIGAEHAYCPQVSQLYEVANMAADLVLRRLKDEDIEFVL